MTVSNCEVSGPVVGSTWSAFFFLSGQKLNPAASTRWEKKKKEEEEEEVEHTFTARVPDLIDDEIARDCLL